MDCLLSLFLSRRFFRAAALVLIGFSLPHYGAWAQTLDATSLRKPADLDSPWLIHGGDDLSYARPGLDDSGWMAFDPHRNIKNWFEPGNPEVVWYRLHVKVNPSETALGLREILISRAFEVYVNGERIMSCGQVAPYAPSTSAARLLAAIPNRLLASGSILIALRVHISNPEWFSGQDPGYFANNLTIGQVDTLYRDGWLSAIGENALNWLDHLLLISLGLIALMLFAAQSRRTEYLWIAAVGLLTLVESPEPIVSAFYNIPFYWEILSYLPRVASPFLWASLYFSFVHQRIGWGWRTFLILAGFTNAISGLQGALFTLPLPLQFLTGLPFIVLLSIVIPFVLALHLWRGNREAGILLIPVIFFSLYIYAEVGFETLFQIPSTRDLALRGLGFIDRYPAGPFSVSLNYLSGILSTLSLALIMLLRSTRMIRRQAMLEGELAAAQQVQQVLLPEDVEMVPGFTVESVYQPAQQVGGDFFQILPAGQGGLLVIVGDVAGKGLPAAMLVSVLVGAIRGVAGFTHNPSALLASLNERLVGRGGGSLSTALAALIAADGTVTIANAGHLSPYLDGIEVELPGALPLGVLNGAFYETSQHYLAPGSRLTFYSDGVVEAQNQKGELFGFDRAKAISTQPAAAIVEAAMQFGQEDDITVVTIARAAAVATAA